MFAGVGSGLECAVALKNCVGKLAFRSTEADKFGSWKIEKEGTILKKLYVINQ